MPDSLRWCQKHSVHHASSSCNLCEKRVIKLTQSQETIIDEADFEIVSKYKWCAWYNKSSNSYYAKSNVGNRTVVSLHRFLTGATNPKLHVDHINGDTLDNRRSNLRVCTAAQNTKNHTKPSPKNKSGFRGVCWSKEKLKWKAYIIVNGKHKHLLYSDDPLKAAEAFDRAALVHYGEFHGKLNILKEGI